MGTANTAMLYVPMKKRTAHFARQNPLLGIVPWAGLSKYKLQCTHIGSDAPDGVVQCLPWKNSTIFLRPWS